MYVQLCMDDMDVYVSCVYESTGSQWPLRYLLPATSHHLAPSLSKVRPPPSVPP